MEENLGVIAHWRVFYSDLWLWTTIILCAFTVFKLLGSNGNTITDRTTDKNNFWTLAYTVAFALIIGLRKAYWTDSWNYARMYSMAVYSDDVVIDSGSEWLWNLLMSGLAKAGEPSSTFFLIICCGYIGFMYGAIRKLFQSNQWIALMFCISSFSFFSYATNGLRQGLAASIVLYAIALYVENKKKVVPILLAIVVMGIHRSLAVPIVCFVAAAWLKKDIKWAIYFWFFCALLSLVAGGWFQGIFMGLGFDDRAIDYLGEKTKEAEFSSSGFRFDFALYSVMPIILAYYITVKQRIEDSKYTLLINTYIFANSFWLLVIRANYSNRFAYLSWFMYAIVIAYPLLKLKIWDNQDKIVGQLLLLYSVINITLAVI